MKPLKVTASVLRSKAESMNSSTSSIAGKDDLLSPSDDPFPESSTAINNFLSEVDVNTDMVAKEIAETRGSLAASAGDYQRTDSIEEQTISNQVKDT